MTDLHRSGCPINLTLEALGDKWSLIVVRDVMFGGRRRFRELLTASQEGIASNILADRLQHLVELGVLTRVADPSHKQKQIYSLSEMGIELLPVFVALGAWGRRFLPATEALSVRAELLERGGSKLLRRFMAELRAEHLRGESVSTVRDELRVAYEQARSKKRRS
ncbi:MAG TPA: helix-turn-helix domain-containing protein [Polyangiaceae bacterium]|nr:helix-turn-helix domain-containing protein [Polyangiaceae bacterium]